MNNRGQLSPEYSFLNPSLFKAQEYAFAIYQEIEAIEGNPLNEKRVAILQEELKNVVGSLKNDFENQTWEDGPIAFQEIEKAIENSTNFEAYQKAKTDNAYPVRPYQELDYWGEKFADNRAQWDAYYKTIEAKGLSHPDIDDYHDLERG